MSRPATASSRDPRNWPLALAFGLLRRATYLPHPTLMALGRGLGRLGLRLVKRRARIAEINLRHCFPELNEAERGVLLRQHAEALGMGAMEVALAWWAPPAKLAPWVHVHGREHLERALEEGRGVILFTGHFTSPELSGRILNSLAPIRPLYRPNEHPYIDRRITEIRLRQLEQIIPRDDVRLMLRALKANKGVWFAPDQNYGHKNSLFSPFFGIPAATNTATSRFARMSGARVVPFVALRRDQGLGHDLYLEPPLEDFPSEDLQRDTDRLNALIEGWIRRAPAQYLWGHRRFKDRPPGEAPWY